MNWGFVLFMVAQVVVTFTLHYRLARLEELHEATLKEIDK